MTVVSPSDVAAGVAFACPACREALAWAGAAASCPACGRRFADADGIPVLLSAAQLAPEKAVQIEYYDSHAEAEHEIDRPWDRPRLHTWMLEEKFRRATRPLGSLLGPGRTCLVVCGGSGLDAELLARSGAEVVTSDISEGAARRALERAGRRGLRYLAVVADAESLPFADRSVDVVFVHDGLHHLPRPEVALDEMARVASEAVSVTEPARSTATSLAVRLRISEHVEEAGNLVRRLELAEIRRTLEARGLTVVRSERYAMFYRDGTGLLTRVGSTPLTAPLARGVVRVAARALSRVGNKLVVVAIRPTRR